jgi:hypothetical protein
MYFKHPVFLPSFAGALLYLTVLSFSGQMVTYLLSAGYDSRHVGIARTLSVAFEVLATWVAPYLMSKIGPIRAGAWLILWQVLFLGAGMAVFWTWAEDRPNVSASGLVGGTILSRLGLRGFDLCIQLIIQEVGPRLFRNQAYCPIYTNLSSPRTSKPSTGVHSLPSKSPGKMCSSSAPTFLPSSSHTQSNSSGLVS